MDYSNKRDALGGGFVPCCALPLPERLFPTRPLRGKGNRPLQAGDAIAAALRREYRRNHIGPAALTGL
jgi:hypothetical protein